MEMYGHRDDFYYRYTSDWDPHIQPIPEVTINFIYITNSEGWLTKQNEED